MSQKECDGRCTAGDIDVSVVKMGDTWGKATARTRCTECRVKLEQVLVGEMEGLGHRAEEGLLDTIQRRRPVFTRNKSQKNGKH